MPTEVTHQHYAIGPFRLDLAADALLRDGEPVTLGKRAIALLRLLIARPGEIVTKDTLIDKAWPGQIVEESNLTAQIAALRRVFATQPGGESWITTLPRRGYRFTGPVSLIDVADPASAPTSAPRLRAASDGRPSLAVLPFRVPEPNGIPRYVADGLVEDVISALAGLSELTVISRGSSFRFRDTDLDLTQVGRDLGVRYIVSGSLRRASERIRVSGELAEAETGLVLSSRSFDADVGSLFGAQDRIVADIVRNLVPRVRDHEMLRIRTKTPSDLRSYDLVMQAMELIYRLDRDSFEKARPLLDQARALDPFYAASLALTAEWHSVRFGQGWSVDPAADCDAVEHYALEAIRQDPTDVRALVRYAHNRSLMHRDYATAMATFDRALDASPNSAVAWMWSSCTHAYVGDGATAVTQAELALRLSPRDLFAFQFYSTLCIAHYTAGDYAEAVRWGMASLAENPRYHSNLRFTAAALVGLSDLAPAKALVRDLLALDPACCVATVVERHPYREAERRQLLGQRLLQAGLPP